MSRQSTPAAGEPAEPASDPNFMASLARGLQVIRAFTEQQPRLTIAEVGRLSGLPRAAARRCLLTLERLGYAGSDGRAFYLTPKILALGYAFLSSTSLPKAVQPFLEQVSETLQESCSAGVLDDDEVVYIARAATRRIMSVGLAVGSRLPAFWTSMGRVLLAHLPPAELRRRLEALQPRAFTERTITDRAQLARLLEQVRQRGYCIVEQELEIGLRSVAVPVVNASGQVVAAMNCGLQAQRVGRRELEGRILPVLQRTAQDLRVLLDH